MQCRGSGIWCFFTPGSGSGMENNSDPGCTSIISSCELNRVLDLNYVNALMQVCISDIDPKLDPECIPFHLSQ
jgi:hypothetical protein